MSRRYIRAPTHMRCGGQRKTQRGGKLRRVVSENSAHCGSDISAICEKLSRRGPMAEIIVWGVFDKGEVWEAREYVILPGTYKPTGVAIEAPNERHDRGRTARARHDAQPRLSQGHAVASAERAVARRATNCSPALKRTHVVRTRRQSGSRPISRSSASVGRRRSPSVSIAIHSPQSKQSARSPGSGGRSSTTDAIASWRAPQYGQTLITDALAFVQRTLRGHEA